MNFNVILNNLSVLFLFLKFMCPPLIFHQNKKIHFRPPVGIHMSGFPFQVCAKVMQYFLSVDRKYFEISAFPLWI